MTQIIQEAAERISFMSMAELRRRIDSGEPGVHILDVREADAYTAGHIPGAVLSVINIRPPPVGAS